MTHESTATPAANTAPLLAAVRRGDFEAAGRALEASPVPTDQLLTLAEGLMRRRRWRDAAWLLGRVEPRQPAVEMKRCLSANLGAMQEHRPALYERLVNLPGTDAFGVAASPSGRPTILARRPDGSTVSFAGGADPLAAASATLGQIRRATPNGESVALCGVGDGYLLQLLAQRPPELFMDMQQAVFVIEPEPQVVLHVLMIHDCTGPSGPIAAERFRWFVGPDWSAALEAAAEREPSIGVPSIAIQQGYDGAAVQAGVGGLIQRLVERDLAAKREIAAYYAAMAPADFAALLGEQPPRTPRVLLITTRFSTVLQYSTRDTAEAFRALGWDAHVLIEPGPSHRMYLHTMRMALNEFKPDLVFQLDHLRHEHGDLIPPNVPFVCWAQDHLPNLVNRGAGGRVGPLDFVLTDNAVIYANAYAYPPRQLIPMSKLTEIPAEPVAGPAASERAVDDIVFVSNASATPERLLNDWGGGWTGSRDGAEILTTAARVLLDAYAAGRAPSMYNEMCQIVRDAQAARGVKLSADEAAPIAKWLTHPFADALYRQQALRWVIAAAGRLGLSVGLYGKGWDARPEFAPFARGPVAYGEPLAAITRAARINLQIVPYLCLHQRLLDGLAAGGFFLVRQHPIDVHPQALLNFINKHAGPDLRSTTAVRRVLAPELLQQFESLLAAAAPGIVIADGDDAVALARDWVECGNLDANGGEVLPRLSEITFDGEGRLAELLNRFGNEPALRDEIRTGQRAAVVGRMSYLAGTRRMLERVASLLTETAAAADDIGGLKKCA